MYNVRKLKSSRSVLLKLNIIFKQLNRA